MERDGDLLVLATEFNGSDALGFNKASVDFAQHLIRKASSCQTTSAPVTVKTARA